MSSERGVRNPSAESPRVPGEGYSAQGKSGAKARPQGVVDAQLVDIPVPLYARSSQLLIAKGLPSGEPTHLDAGSKEGTQEDR